MNHYPHDHKELRIYNLRRYGSPPSWELIEKVINKSGLKYQSVFAIVFGIGQKLLTEYKNGKKMLPPKYWHIFYDFKNVVKSRHRFMGSLISSKHNNEDIQYKPTG